MTKLPPQFIERMKKLLGDELSSFLKSYEQKSKKGIRINTLRCTKEQFIKLSPFELFDNDCTTNSDSGFVVKDEADCGKHPYHMAGAYYIQEPSAMSAIDAIADMDLENMRILDLCAAPGGKTGAAAALMNGTGIIVSNEIVAKRAQELAKNIERLGITNAVATNCRPDVIAKKLPGYFDIVIVDAPCSGEGMFRKNPDAVLEWSPEHVSACANRQLAILDSAAECVKYGGYILYSTCTFSVEENEQTAEKFCNKYGFEIVKQKRIYPHSSCGEGHFVCLMKRNDIVSCITDDFKNKSNYNNARETKNSKQKSEYKKCNDKLWLEFVKDNFLQNPEQTAYISDAGKVILASEEMLEIARDLPCISCGVLAGYVKKGYFEPSHTLFMASSCGKVRLTVDFSPNSDELSSFLHGESVISPFSEKEKGYCLITTDGFPLGFCKVSDGMLKNKLPKGIRK